MVYKEVNVPKISFKKIPLFNANKEFSLIESQCEKSIGRTFPKDFYC